MKARTATVLAAVWLAVILLAALAVHRHALHQGLDRLAASGQARLAQAAERLTSQLDSYRAQVNMLARDPRLVAALIAADGALHADPALRDHVLRYGAARIWLLDRDGVLVASSGGPPLDPGGHMLTAALRGRLGFTHMVDANRRLFLLSRGVIDGQAPPIGAVILSVAIDALEFEWSLSPEAIGFFDPRGVYVVSDRLVLQHRHDRAIAAADTALPAFPAYTARTVGGHTLWRFAGTPELPREVLIVDRPVARLGLTARGFIDLAPARAAARQQAALAAAVLALIGLVAGIIALWRRRLADLLAVQTAANAELEHRVAARTAELQATQHQLVQAGKMTALGEMSAGISHELNQPLAAILTFADNARQFLERGRQAEAGSNLGLIGEQVERISRIIRHLRAFARNEDVELKPVDVVGSVREALALLEPLIEKQGTALELDLPDRPVLVTGGRVRLQQVVVNLLTNAVDAMRASDDPRLALSLQTAGDNVVLRVRDHGPGLADPSRVFEPFYSTKELGASKGLGLGLTISYGIIGSFGGTITAENATDGGALFTIALRRA